MTDETTHEEPHFTDEWCVCDCPSCVGELGACLCEPCKCKVHEVKP